MLFSPPVAPVASSSFLSFPPHVWDATPQRAVTLLFVLPSHTALRSELPMPPRIPGQAIPASTSLSPWYGKLRGRKVHPNPTEKNLGEQVHYRHVKRKHRPALRALQTRDPAER